MSSETIDGVTVRPLNPLPIPGTTAGRTKGYADGYTRGWSQAIKAAAAESEKEQQRFAAEMAEQKRRYAQQMEQALLVLDEAVHACRAAVLPVVSDAAAVSVQGSVEIAQAVLGVELADRGASVRAALARVTALDSHERLLRIRLHPRDTSVLTEVELPAGVEVIADETLSPGDAVGELVDGYIEAHIEAALKRICESLGAELPGAVK